MNSFRIVVVEDDVLIGADLAASLSDLGYTVCAVCSDARAAMLAILKHHPDLVLLDINLGRGADGIRIAEEVNAHHDIPFIFVTGHTDDGTLERVKRVRPAGFIIKPFDTNDLRTQIEIALARFATRSESGLQKDSDGFVISENLFVRDKGSLVKVPIADIHYAAADLNYVVLHTSNKRYVLTSTLTGLEKRLPAQRFMRIHRGYLIDLERITAIREKCVMLGDTEIPVGRTYREGLRKRLDLL